MAEFLTGTKLDEKLTDIIWQAKKELIILSPFIRLDGYCKNIFQKIKNKPELEVIIVFGKNEGETQRSLVLEDLELFKELSNVVIIYCPNLHAKFYSNEDESLLTSLNLLGKSMTGNVEYGISFQNPILGLEKLYSDALKETMEVVYNNKCVYVKRPSYKKNILPGFPKKYLSSEVIFDVTRELYSNRKFDLKKYKDFDTELMETNTKPLRENFVDQDVKQFRTHKVEEKHTTYNKGNELGYCIRTGQPIPFDVKRPFSYEAYQSWANFKNYDFPEKFCHRTGQRSNGRTSMNNPIL